jgi:carbamoyl-phosphate synthase large subunit
MASDISTAHPILIDKYITGREMEVDGICDGNEVLIPGIMEHIERAGVHSGDSIAVYPPRNLSRKVKDTIEDYTIRLSKALKVVGLFNIQFVMDSNEKVYVIEVNPRASRTVPIMSKITGIPMVSVATKLIMGKKLSELGYRNGLAKETEFYAVKAPVFSFAKLTTVDTFLGPEMKSTGEVMGVDKDYYNALYKAIAASGMKIPSGGNVLLSVAERDKEESIDIAGKLLSLGFKLSATAGTYKVLSNAALPVDFIENDSVLDFIKEDKITLVINTPTRGKLPERKGFILRRTAMEYNIPCITSLDTTNAVLSILERLIHENRAEVYSLDEYSVFRG